MTTGLNADQGLIRSALLAGFIAGFIWMAITVSVGGFSNGAVVGGGFAFLVGTALATFVIARIMGSRARP